MTEINRLGLNTSNIYNNNEAKAKPEGKEEAKEQASPQTPAEDRSVAPDDVLSYMAQTAAVVRASVEAQAPKSTPVNELMSALVAPVVEGLKEFSTANKLEKAEAYKVANPGVEERMDGWMQALDEEIGALFA